MEQKQQNLCNWNSCNLKIIYIVQIHWSHLNFLSDSLIKTPIIGTHLIQKIIYFWSCNSYSGKKYSHRILFFFEIIFLDFFLNETRLVKEEPRFKLNHIRHSVFVLLIPDVHFFYFCSYQMFEFALVDLCLNLSHHMMQNWTCYYPAWNKKQTYINHNKCVNHRWSNILPRFPYRMKFDFDQLRKVYQSPDKIRFPRRILSDHY